MKTVFFLAAVILFCFIELDAQNVPATLGMQTKNYSSSTQDLEDIKNTGAKYIRRGFIWSSVEKYKGVYDFSGYDRLMQDAADRGLFVLGTLYGGNTLYEDDGLGGIQTEAGRQGFAAFSAALADRYRNRNIIWEIWNEPNVGTFWRAGEHNTDAFAEEYTALVKETAAAMVAADSECFVMAGSVSAFWEPSYYWTNACFERGIGESGIRGWSVHPYGLKTPEEYSVGYARFREIFVNNGMPGNFPLYNSERGFSLEKLDEGWSGGNIANAEEYQAWHFVRQYMIDLLNNIKLSIWYEWEGEEFGVIYQGEKRKSYSACVHMVDELAGYTYVERLTTDSPQDYLLLFADTSGNQKVVAWTAPLAGDAPDEFVKHTVDVFIGFNKRISVNTLYGKEDYFSVGNDRINLELTGSPKYVSIPAQKHDATLSAITWPDAPLNILSDPHWKHDTIPGFDPETLNYRISLPEGTESVPVLVATPEDPNANVLISGAATLNGPRPERTATIEVTAEDDRTRINYTIIFELNNPVPVVWSHEYLVNNDSLTIHGVPQGTRVDDFISNLLSDSTGLMFSVSDHGSGSVKLPDDTVTDLDTLKVYTPDSACTTTYTVHTSGNGLDNNAVLTSDYYPIEIKGSQGMISGFPFGTSIRTVLDSVEIPPHAALRIINSRHEPVPLRILNFDANYVDKTVSEDVYFEVTAEDMHTVITYQFQPDDNEDEVFIWSDMFEVNQQTKLISGIPSGMNVLSFLSRIWTAGDNSIKIIDQQGMERTLVAISPAYQAEVMDRSGTKKKRYYLELLGEEGEFAYVLSDFFTVNQTSAEIYGISDTLTIETFMEAITLADMATARVTDDAGNEKGSGTIDPDVDKLVVTSGNGENAVIYSLMKAPKYAVTFFVSDETGPVGGAEIILDGDTLLTNFSGTAFTKMPAGVYEYFVSGNGKISQGTVTVEDTSLNVNVIIKEVTYTLSIMVTDGSSPVPDALIIIDGRYFMTNDSGRISVDLPAGTFDYRVTISGYSEQVGSVVLEDAGKDLEVVMMKVSAIVTSAPELRIYPNPSNGEVNILRPTGGNDPMEIRLHDVSGKLIYLDEFGSAERNVVDLKALEKGIYFLEIRFEKYIINKKLIIQ